MPKRPGQPNPYSRGALPVDHVRLKQGRSLVLLALAAPEKEATSADRVDTSEKTGRTFV